MNKIFATNVATKFEDGAGVLLNVPIVQLGSKISDNIWTISVNTCKSLSAFNATSDAPNRSFNVELGDFIRYIKKDFENNVADKDTYKDLLETLEEINIIFDGNDYVSNIIFDKGNDVLSVISGASEKNNMLALNFAGYADYDGFGANFSEEKNNILLFAKNTGIKMNCRNRARCITWISTEHLNKLTENIKKLYKKNGCRTINSGANTEEYYFYCYLLQASMHTVAMNNRNQSPAIRKKMIDNFYKMANGFIEGDFSLFDNKKIKSNRPEDVNKNFVNAMMDIILDGVEIDNKQKDKWVETAITLATNISLADHATQLLVCDFDLYGRIPNKDGFIGKNNFFYLPMSKILGKIIKYYGVNSARSRRIKKVLEYIKNHEPKNLWRMRNKIDFSELTDEKENKFGNNGRKIKNYSTDIKCSDFVEKERIPDDILKNISADELAKYLINEVDFDLNQIELIDKNIIREIIESKEENMKLAAENLFSYYFNLVPKDLWYLIPNSCFEMLLEPEISASDSEKKKNKLETMTPDEQFNLLNQIDRSDFISEMLNYIQTDAFIRLQNENKINFSKIVSKLSSVSDKDFINNFIDLSKLENYAVEDILLARFNNLIDDKFNQIDYGWIDNFYVKKILKEKFYCLTQESIDKIKADAYKDLDIKTWINILNLALERNINLPLEVIKLVNLCELKNKNLELYNKFILKNLDGLSDEQFLTLNIKVFDSQEQKDFYIKLSEQIKKRNMENNKLAQEVFDINYISESEFELDKIKSLDINTLSYIFERYELYSGFIDGLLKKIDASSLDMISKIFKGPKENLINKLDTRKLSGIVLNKLVELFLNDLDESQICQIADLNVLEQKNFEKLLKNRLEDLNPEQFKSFFKNKPDYKKLIFMVKYAKELKTELDKTLETQDSTKADEAGNNFYQLKSKLEKAMKNDNLDAKEENFIKYPEYLAAKEKYYEECNKLKSTQLEKKYNDYVMVIKNYVSLLDMKSIRDEHGFVEKPYYNVTSDFEEFCNYNRDNFSERQIIDLGASLYNKDGFTCDFVLHNLEVLYDKINLSDLVIRPKTDYLKLIKRDLNDFAESSDGSEREEYAKSTSRFLCGLPKRILDNLYLSAFPSYDKQGFSDLYNCLWLFSYVDSEADFEFACKKIYDAIDRSVGKRVLQKDKIIKNRMINLCVDVLSRGANDEKFKPNEEFVFNYFINLVLDKTKSDKFSEDDLDKILDNAPAVSIYVLNNLLGRLDKRDIKLKKETGLKLINCLKLDKKIGSYDAIINLFDLIEDSSLSDKEINNLLKHVEKENISDEQKLLFENKLLSKIENISELETLFNIFIFTGNMDNQSISKILDKTTEDFKINADALKGLIKLSKNNMQLGTLNKILKKTDFLSVSITNIKNLFLKSLVEKKIYTREEIEETLKIINDNHMEFRFEGEDNSGFIEQYQIVHYLFSRLKPEEQDLNYKNRLLKKMCFRFWTDYPYRDQGSDQNSIQDKFKFIVKKFLKSAIDYHRDYNPYLCSSMGRYFDLFFADSSINYIFLYGLENINLDGIDNETKNKILIDEVINFIGSRERAYLNDVYFLTSYLEILTKSKYKIDEATLKKLCGSLFIDCASKTNFKTKNFVCFTASCIKRLERLYDGKGKSFDGVMRDFIKEAKNKNEFGARREVINLMEFTNSFEDSCHYINYRYYSYDNPGAYVIDHDLERYCAKCASMYKDISEINLTEQEISEVVRDKNELKRQLDEKKKSDEYRKKLAVLSRIIKGEEMSDLVIYLKDDKINYLREKYKDMLDDILSELNLMAAGIDIEKKADEAKKIIEERYGSYSYENANKWLISFVSSYGVSLSATAGLVLSTLFACNPALILGCAIASPVALGLSIVSRVKNKNNNRMVNKFMNEVCQVSKNKSSKFKDTKAKLKKINKTLDNIKRDLRDKD